MARNPRPLGTTLLVNSWDIPTRMNATDYGYNGNRIEKAGDDYSKPPVKPKSVRSEMPSMRKLTALRGQLIANGISDPDSLIASTFKWDGYRFVERPPVKSTASVRRVDPAESVKVEVKSRSGETVTMTEAELVKRMQNRVARWRAKGIAEDVIRQRVARKLAA